MTGCLQNFSTEIMLDGKLRVELPPALRATSLSEGGLQMPDLYFFAYSRVCDKGRA